MNGLTLKLLAYNIWTTFLEGAPSTTGNLDKNVNEIAVEIVLQVLLQEVLQLRLHVVDS